MNKKLTENMTLDEYFELQEIVRKKGLELRHFNIRNGGYVDSFSIHDPNWEETGNYPQIFETKREWEIRQWINENCIE